MDHAIAIHLLKLMGHSGTVPSAILPADIPAALTRLKAHIAASPPAQADASAGDDDNLSKIQVSLRQRAFPLIELLTRAADRGHQVMWQNAR